MRSRMSQNIFWVMPIQNDPLSVEIVIKIIFTQRGSFVEGKNNTPKKSFWYTLMHRSGMQMLIDAQYPNMILKVIENRASLYYFHGRYSPSFHY